MMLPPLCEAVDIQVRFPGVVACDGVGLDLAAGEVHAIVGENGAGKSTLMHVLAGIVRADAGEVRVAGVPVRNGRPRDARRAGIAMVYQRFRLLPSQTVARNVVLGTAGEPFLLSDVRLNRKVQEVADRLDLGLDAGATVEGLSAGERQRVEILRAFYRGARVLILDEPTSVLTPGEGRSLMTWVRGRAAAGVGVLLVSHKLSEVLAVADRVTVMRRGRVIVAGLRADGCSAGELARLIVGDRGPTAAVTPAMTVAANPAEASVRPPVGTRSGPGSGLLLDQVSLRASGGAEALRDVVMAIRPGEIVGVAGVAGNGQRLLADVAAGLVAPDSGAVRVAGRDLAGRGPAAFLEAGVRYVPEARDDVAVARTLSVADNAVLRAWREPGVVGGRFLSPARMAGFAGALLASSGVRVPSLDVPAGALSGGNVQRLILGREIASGPAVLVVAQPTQGLDVTAAAGVRAGLVALREAGVAVLLIDSDLDEVLELSDRLFVMFRGRSTEVGGGRPFDREAVGRRMTAGGES